MATAVPVLWTYDDSALEEAAVALTRLRTAPPAFCPGPRKTSRGGSGNSARSGEALSPTTPALADDGSDPAPAPEALEVPGSTEEESDAEDESPRHADGADAEIAQAYGCAPSAHSPGLPQVCRASLSLAEAPQCPLNLAERD